MILKARPINNYILYKKLSETLDRKKLDLYLNNILYSCSVRGLKEYFEKKLFSEKETIKMASYL